MSYFKLSNASLLTSDFQKPALFLVQKIYYSTRQYLAFQFSSMNW